MPQRVLIIDDDRAIAQLTRMVVESGGYEALVAHDGRTGLELAREHTPDAVLLDIRMPDMDGFAVNSALRADPRLADVPVIFLSANVQETARRRAAAVGAAGFMAKPYEANAVLVAVERAVAPRSEERRRP